MPGLPYPGERTEARWRRRWMRLMADSSTYLAVAIRDVKSVHGNVHFGGDAGQLNIYFRLAQSPQQIVEKPEPVGSLNVYESEARVRCIVDDDLGRYFCLLRNAVCAQECVLC